MPFFSVIIPAFNRLHLLQRTLDSVLQQSFPDFELILSDDGSTDGTGEWVAGLNNEQLIYLYQENKGVCAARNRGAAIARGSYLVFLDSDDTVSPNWLADFHSGLAQTPADVITCRRKLIGKKEGTYQGFLAGTFAVKRCVFEAVGGYDTQLKFGENTELKWRLEEHGARFAQLDAVNVLYEIQPGGGGTNQKNRVDFFYYVREKHRAFFEREKPTAQLLYQVAGVLCCQLGRTREGIDLLWKGYFIQPYQLKPLGRAVWHSVKGVLKKKNPPTNPHRR